MKRLHWLGYWGLVCVLLLANFGCNRPGAGAAAVAYNYFLYVASIAGDAVYGYSIDETTGALTPITGFPLLTSDSETGENPTSLAVSPNGNFVYTINNGSPYQIFIYSLNAETGALTQTDDSPVSVSSGNCAQPYRMIFTSDGTKSYVTCNHASGGTPGGGIQAYTVNTETGALTENGSRIALAQAQFSVLHPDETYLYTSTIATQFIYRYDIAADGTLSNETSYDQGAGVTFNLGLSIVTDGDQMYWSSTGGGLRGVSLSSGAIDSALTDMPLSLAPSLPFHLRFDSNFQYAYTVFANSENVTVYERNSTTGALTATGSELAMTAAGSRWISIDPENQFLYVPNYVEENVYAYTVSETDGSLTAVDGSPYSLESGHRPDSSLLVRVEEPTT